MSAMNIHTPEPGWRTRWPKEAALLLLRSPGAFAIYMILMPLSGAIEGVLMGAPQSFIFLISPLALMIQGAVGILVATLMCRLFYVREGFPPAPLRTSLLADAFRSPLPALLAILIASAILSLVLDLESRPMTSWVEPLLEGYSDLVGLLIVAFTFGPSVSALSAGGTGFEENRILSRMVLKALEKMIYGLFFILVVIVVVAGIFPLSGLVLGPMLIAMSYVATREMVGGPGAKIRAREGIRGAVPQAG